MRVVVCGSKDASLCLYNAVCEFSRHALFHPPTCWSTHFFRLRLTVFQYSPFSTDFSTLSLSFPFQHPSTHIYIPFSETTTPHTLYHIQLDLPSNFFLTHHSTHALTYPTQPRPFVPYSPLPSHSLCYSPPVYHRTSYNQLAVGYWNFRFLHHGTSSGSPAHPKGVLMKRYDGCGCLYQLQ